MAELPRRGGIHHRLRRIDAWIPIVALLHAAEKRRRRETAKSFCCLTCGEHLGVAGVKLANEAWAAEMEQLMRDHPGARFRILRTLDAICPTCGARYTYLDAERTFIPESRVEGSSTACPSDVPRRTFP